MKLYKPPYDKSLHVNYCLSIHIATILFYRFLNLFFYFCFSENIAALLAVIIIAIGRELRSKITGDGTADYRDAIWTIIPEIILYILS